MMCVIIKFNTTNLTMIVSYTQSYMGTGINFQPGPIFRTGVIQFCHPCPFWNCVLLFSYTSPFLELYYYTNHSILLFYCFPANTFRNVLLHFPPHCFQPVSQNCTATLFYCAKFSVHSSIGLLLLFHSFMVLFYHPAPIFTNLSPVISAE
jgi:hypothetical protein